LWVCWCGALSLTREWVCHLQLLLDLTSTVILGFKSRGCCDHILLSQIQDFPFHCLLWHTGLQWRYLTTAPHGHDFSWITKWCLQLPFAIPWCWFLHIPLYEPACMCLPVYPVVFPTYHTKFSFYFFSCWSHLKTQWSVLDSFMACLSIEKLGLETTEMPRYNPRGSYVNWPLSGPWIERCVYPNCVQSCWFLICLSAIFSAYPLISSFFYWLALPFCPLHVTLICCFITDSFN
jgi:hypothetical protein